MLGVLLKGVGKRREGIKARIKDVLSCRLKLQDDKITWSISEGRAPVDNGAGCPTGGHLSQGLWRDQVRCEAAPRAVYWRSGNNIPNPGGVGEKEDAFTFKKVLRAGEMVRSLITCG